MEPWILLNLALIAAASGALVSLRDLSQQATTDEPTLREGIRIAGKVLASDPGSGRMAMADESGTAILNLRLPPDAWEEMVPGKMVELAFPPTSFALRSFEIDCGGGYLIEMERRLPRTGQDGAVYLRKGKLPLQLEWFNTKGPAVLQLGLAGPGFSHDSIPRALLSYSGEPGLRCERFHVKVIGSLGEIPASGSGEESFVASRIDTSLAGDGENVALRFSGDIQVPGDGAYTFHLTRSGGARLKIGGEFPRWKIMDIDHTLPHPSWLPIGGNVTYAAMEGSYLRLEVAGVQKKNSEITVLNPAGMPPSSLIGRHITAAGMAYEGGICVLAAGQLQFGTPDIARSRPLTRITQIREMRREQAALAQPLAIAGVVTAARDGSIIIQDESGGAFVEIGGCLLERQPEPGDRWIVEGHTGPGDFSPIIVAEHCRYQGIGALPAPHRPNWEEILSGSLDAERVEIEGIVTSTGEDRVNLLTRDGTAVIRLDDFFPQPIELRRATASGLQDARLKLRGVFGPSWDPSSGRLKPGVFSLGNASLSVVEPAPRDPSEVPLVTIPDLWRFTSQSKALNRVRLQGRMMAQTGDTLLVSDGTRGLRLESASAQGGLPGDLVEVVGFARTGPISPVIGHPVLRVLERASLPPPRVMNPRELPDLSLDGSSIRLEARVLSDTLQSGERRLELESGDFRFVAVGAADSSDSGPFLRDSTVRVDGVYYATTPSPVTMGPGHFEVRMSGGQAIQLLLRPPWWSTRRLLLLVAILVGGLALVAGWAAMLRQLVQRRTSQLALEIEKKEHAETERTLEQERARVARDLHDELGAGLTEIGLLSSLVANPAVAADSKSEYLETLDDVSRSLVSSLDEIVWAINPDYDPVEDLAGYLWLHARRLLTPAGILCKAVRPEQIPGGSLGSRARQALLLAFKEALNNVIKHSGATRVDLGIHAEEEYVVVSITDDGCGIPGTGTPPPGSQGISGMHRRMRDQGGRCDISSRPGGGTVVTLTLPLTSS